MMTVQELRNKLLNYPDKMLVFVYSPVNESYYKPWVGYYINNRGEIDENLVLDDNGFIAIHRDLSK